MEQRLRRSGLKATRQRIAILQCLEQAGGEALTAEELYEQLNPTTAVDRSTVYRCLEALESVSCAEADEPAMNKAKQSLENILRIER